MKSYLSQSLEWKLITTSPMKRLQPLRNKNAVETFLKFFALLDLPSALLVTCDQCIENEVEEGCSKTGSSSVASELPASEKSAFEFSLNLLSWGQRERETTALLAEDSGDSLTAEKPELFFTYYSLFMLWCDLVFQL